MSRLETSMPLLASRLLVANAESQRRVAVTAASWAAEAAALRQPKVTEALRNLRQGALEAARSSELAELVNELDEAAWSMQDAVDAGSASLDDYLTAFGRARAAAAVMFAADSDPVAAALDAIYEASVVLADSAPLVAAVERVLDP